MSSQKPSTRSKSARTRPSRPFAAPGTVSLPSGATTAGGEDPLLLLDHYTKVPTYSLEEVKELLDDQWPVVLRLGRRVERYGVLTVHLFQSALSHEFCFQHRDSNVLRQFLEECTEGETVSWTKLRSKVAGCGGRRTTGLGPSAPPFAVKGDHVFSSNQQRGSQDAKREIFEKSMRNAVKGRDVVSRKEFHNALSQVEHYGISEREAHELYSVLDPKNSGMVSVNDFLSRFLSEFLKPKSMRNTMSAAGADGKEGSFSWPQPPAPPRSARKDRGGLKKESPRDAADGGGGGASPRSATNRDSGTSPSRSASSPHRRGVKMTKASLLRRETGDVSRRLQEEHNMYYASPRNTTSPERPQSSKLHSTTGALELRLPRPPPSRGMKIKTSIVADPCLLGNKLPPV